MTTSLLGAYLSAPFDDEKEKRRPPSSLAESVWLTDSLAAAQSSNAPTVRDVVVRISALTDVRSATVYVIDDSESCAAFANIFHAETFSVQSVAHLSRFLETYDYGAGCLLVNIDVIEAGIRQFADEMRTHKIDLPIIATSCHGDVSTAVNAIKSGAARFLVKPVDNAKLLTIVRSAVEHHLLQRQQRCAYENQRNCRLTLLEREIMMYLTAGKTSEEIALCLGIDVRAVEENRLQVMRKLNVKSLIELLHSVVNPAQVGE